MRTRMALNPPDLRPDRAPRAAARAARPPGPAPRRHGQPRLPQGAGRQRAHPDPAPRRGLRDLARLRRRRRGDRQHLRLSRQRQGREPRGDRRGAGRERPGHRHRLPRRRRGADPRRAPDGARRDRPAAVRGGARRGARRGAARAQPLRRPPAGDGRHSSRRATTATSRFPRVATTSAASASSPTCAASWSPGPAHAVLREAERLVAAGVRELLVISQDTSAYGTDRRHDAHDWRGRPVRSHITDLARELGTLGAWVRLHYVYPYPHVRELIPLMAEGRILPYLDIPFQHSHPDVLKRMARPAAERPHARRDRPLARRLPGARAALDLHRRLSRRDRGRVRAPARLARRRAARPGRLLPLRERHRRPRQRPARSRPRGGQGGALAALHGQGAGDQRREARGARRHAASR